jgi:deazaflavin-dependent oxidoreductase (nitroreductase family)
LRAAPRANVQVRGDRFEIAAAEAQGAERERLWAAVKKFNPFYAQYEQITDRRIPVVVLRRTS